MYSDLLPLLGLIVLSGIFSGSETALVSVSRSKVDELVDQKRKNAKLLKKMKNDPHKLLITVLIGNNIVNIGAAGYAAIIFTDIFGSSGVGIATGVMTFLILIFGEITPKSIAHEYAVPFSLFIARPIYILQIILFPLVWFFEVIVKAANFMVGAKKMTTVTEGELVAMLKIGAQEGSIEKHERELIENVLEFNDIQVEEVMTPRVSIDAVDSEMTIKEAVDFAIEHSHSRLPVYDGDVDSIIGIITIKDLLEYYHINSSNKKLKSLKLAMPLEVPLSKQINKLFREFQRKHVHIAIVIDEYGGTAGLVTLEDLLEEIVGEIVDEFDNHERPIEIVDKNTIIVDGSIQVDDVNDFFKLTFDENEHDSISTLITEKLQRFPREGDIIEFPLGSVLVIKMAKTLVKRVKITIDRSKKLK